MTLENNLKFLWFLHSSSRKRKSFTTFITFEMKSKRSLSFHWLMITNLTWKCIFGNNPFFLNPFYNGFFCLIWWDEIDKQSIMQIRNWYFRKKICSGMTIPALALFSNPKPCSLQISKGLKTYISTVKVKSLNNK